MPTSWWIQASNFLILWREVLWNTVKLQWNNPSAMKLSVTMITRPVGSLFAILWNDVNTSLTLPACSLTSPHSFSRHCQFIWHALTETWEHGCVARQHDVSARSLVGTSVALHDPLGRSAAEYSDFCADVKLLEQPFCWKSARALFQLSRKRMGHAHTLLLTCRFLVAPLMTKNCKIYHDPGMNIRTTVLGRVCSEVPSSLPLDLQLLRRYSLCPLHR